MKSEKTKSTAATLLLLSATESILGNSVEELRTMVKDAVRVYFDETMEAPKIIRLHFVRDDVLA